MSHQNRFFPQYLVADESRDSIQRAIDGDKNAVLIIFGLHVRVFRRTIRRYLARNLNKLFDAEDILQDASLRLLATPLPVALFHPVVRFVSFANAVVQHLVQKHNRQYLDYKRRNVRREVPFEGAWNNNEGPIARESSAHDLLMEKELWLALLDEQPVDDSFAMLAFTLAGYTTSQISAGTGISEQSIPHCLDVALKRGAHAKLKRKTSRQQQGDF